MSQIKDKKYYIYVPLLCFFSGYINILTVNYLGFTISHFSGSLTVISEFFLKKDINLKIFQLLILIIIFLLGAIFVSFLGEEETEKNIKNYGKGMASFGVIIILIELLMGFHKEMLYLLTFSMGFQNGMAIKFKDYAIRTTHMTGNLTELGTHIGKLLKGKKGVLKHIILNILEIILFVFGGIIAAYFSMYYKEFSIIIYSALYILFGIVINIF